MKILQSHRLKINHKRWVLSSHSFIPDKSSARRIYILLVIRWLFDVSDDFMIIHTQSHVYDIM